MSALPRRDEVPPSDASVAAERPGVAQREDGCGHKALENPSKKKEKTKSKAQCNTTPTRYSTPPSDTACEGAFLIQIFLKEALSLSAAGGILQT